MIPSKQYASEFFDFLKTYGIIGLAIAVIIGGKLNDLVTSLVNDLLMPLALQPLLKSLQLDDIRKLNYQGIFNGKVLGSLIDFTIVALIVFLFAKLILKEEKVAKE